MRCLINQQRYRALSIALALSFLISTSPVAGLARGEESASTSKSESQSTAATTPGPAPGEATPEELEELVSPIALYPDLLVARILVASTFPTQIVEAQRWLEQNPNLKGDQFAEAVNAQPWDPSVRSLAQFRDVLKTMNDSLSWTSALGEAYYNQPDDVMDAIQQLRNRAVKAGTLKDTPQQKIETKAAAPEPAEGGGAPEGGATQQQTVVIEPAQQNTVYVPQYDPTTAYGAPVAAPVGYAAPAGYTGTEMLTTGLLSFGAGMGLMALINDGDDDWNCGWDGGGGNTVNYNKNVYANRGNNYARGQGQARQGSRQARRDTRQAGRNPGATPYAGGGRGAGAMRPTARPYNAASARPYRSGGPGGGKPTFPKASTLPANAGLGGGASAAGRGVGQGALSNQRQNRAQQQRGFGANTPNRSTKGGRTGAFGGYGSGGRAQAAGNRGRSSLGGRGGGGGGRRGGGGGGGGRRGGGGGGRGRR
jgi:Protein of unknown function (DUF3300)